MRIAKPKVIGLSLISKGESGVEVGARLANKQTDAARRQGYLLVANTSPH